MGYKHLVFDIDGTLMDTEQANILSLQQTVKELQHREIPASDLNFILGITGADALRRLGFEDIPGVSARWIEIMRGFSDTVHVFGGIPEVLSELSKICRLGIVTSRTIKEYNAEMPSYGLDRYFSTIVCSDDTDAHKPDPAPLLKYLEKTGAAREEVLYIGDSIYDMQCARGAGVAFALATWGCRSRKHIAADYYPESPADIAKLLNSKPDSEAGICPEPAWLRWAKELQFIGQAGVTYSTDEFDRERFERIREISAEIMSSKTGFSVEHVREVFCNETGFQTPKLDTRAAIFKNDQILLVQEKNGLWSMPGGWVDVNQSVRSNAIKEVKEESGLDVVPVKLIALQDRNRHNQPPYAYGVTKAFLQCEVTGGSFEPNIETLQAAYFSQDQLPPLAEEKVNADQICLCFEAYHSVDWVTQFD